MTTTFDFTPLFRSSIGFDRMLSALEKARRIDSIDNWPPYDIIKVDEDRYRITMAVAGFTDQDLSITHERNMLVVGGRRTGEDASQYLHRGIAARPFQRSFELADHVRVLGANLANGILTVELQREIPEEMKPRNIGITVGSPALAGNQPKQIEATTTVKQAA